MNPPGLAARLRYAFDNFMARGTRAMVLGLAVLSVAIVVVAGLVVALLGIAPPEGGPLSPAEATWLSLMHTLDSGMVSGDAGSAYRVAMFAVTLGGLFITGTLIGVLSSGIEAKLDELRRGRSKVIETGHTVILGWSEQVFPVVRELIAAQSGRRRHCVVILGTEDKPVMEEALRERVPDPGRTRLVCRSGDPIEPLDLALVSVDTARSILVIPPRDNVADVTVIKTLLAILKHPNRKRGPYQIVSVLRERRNLEVARMVAGREGTLVLAEDITSRMVAQTCRQPGLSVIYRELLDFDGDELYFRDEPGLAGRRFGEALLAYENASVIGYVPQGRAPRLLPPMETPLGAGDQLIAIAADASSFSLRAPDASVVAVAAAAPELPPVPEVTLVLGWNRRGGAILRNLDAYVPKGSQLKIVAESGYDALSGGESMASALDSLERQLGRTEAEAVAAGWPQAVATGLSHHAGQVQHADPTNREVLDKIEVGRYDHVIILASDDLAPQASDARTLVTLLHLHDIAAKSGRRFSIVCEMLDEQNRELAEVVGSNDFVVSDQLISLLLAQLAEKPALAAVFEDLFDPEGAEIYLKPAAAYTTLNQTLSFAEIVSAGRQKGEIVIGYRLAAEAGDASLRYGIHLNPPKSARVTLSDADRVIVLAEE